MAALQVWAAALLQQDTSPCCWSIPKGDTNSRGGLRDACCSCRLGPAHVLPLRDVKKTFMQTDYVLLLPCTPKALRPGDMGGVSHMHVLSRRAPDIYGVCWIIPEGETNSTERRGDAGWPVQCGTRACPALWGL